MTQEEPRGKNDITLFGVKTTKEKLKEATKEELAVTAEKWAKWTIRLVIWVLIIKSIWVYWVDHDTLMASIFSLLSITISTSNSIYNLEKKLKIKGVI